MPYSPGHRDTIRKRIIQAARKLFNRSGFEKVSVNQIMAEAGLTRGGFYSYFDSKSDLYVEVLSCFFTDPSWNNTWEGVEIDLTARQIGPQIVRAYLSRQHFENVDGSCPMIALPSDVAHEGQKAKQAFEKVFRAMVGFLEGGSLDRHNLPATTAQAIAALCVGGMVVARAIDDRSLADELRNACLAVAFKLAGWDETAARCGNQLAPKTSRSTRGLRHRRQHTDEPRRQNFT